MAADIAHWVAVASAEHVAIGRAQGFMQVGQGKGAPLKRLHAGDRIAYYSPVRVMGGKEACQAFTAIGTVRDERVYQGVMAGGFEPFRKDVAWSAGHEAPIRPLLEALSFTQGKPNWGYALRFGLLKVTAADMACIAQAMGARLDRDESVQMALST
jgi:EVE domain